MIDNNKNQPDIKRIIDPKNGYSLYIRKFSDSNIAQVSPDQTFPIPEPPKASKATPPPKDLTPILLNIKKQNQQLTDQIQAVQAKMNHQQQKIKYLYIAMLVAAALLFLT